MVGGRAWKGRSEKSLLGRGEEKNSGGALGLKVAEADGRDAHT
jgi:hypothetical protein